MNNNRTVESPTISWQTDKPTKMEEVPLYLAEKYGVIPQVVKMIVSDYNYFENKFKS